jgi:hypothetical protein
MCSVVSQIGRVFCCTWETHVIAADCLLHIQYGTYKTQEYLGTGSHKKDTFSTLIVGHFWNFPEASGECMASIGHGSLNVITFWKTKNYLCKCLSNALIFQLPLTTEARTNEQA